MKFKLTFCKYTAVRDRGNRVLKNYKGRLYGVKEILKIPKGTFHLINRKQTDNAMAKKKKDKQQYTKHNTGYYCRLSIQTYQNGMNSLIRKGKQILFYSWHPSWCLCKPSPFKGLNRKETCKRGDNWYGPGRGPFVVQTHFNFIFLLNS